MDRRVERAQRFAKVAGVAILAAAIAEPAAAQRVSGDNRPFSNGGVTSFAPVQGSGYRIDGSVSTLYDSNILRGGDGFPPPPNLTESDFRITPRVSAAIGKTVGRQQLFFGGEFGRDFYLRNSELNRNRYGVGGGANLRVGQSCEGSVSGEFLSQSALLSEFSSTQVPGTNRNDVQTTRNYNASASCSPPIGIGFGGSIRHNDTRYQNSLRNVFNARSTAYSGNLSYGLPAIGIFQLGGGYTRVDYPRRSVFTSVSSSGLLSDTDGLDIYNARLGYRRGLGVRMTIEAGIGYNKVKPDPKTIFFEVLPNSNIYAPSTRGGYGGIAFDGTLTYRPSPRLTGDLSFSRDVTSSPTVGALFVINTVVGADASYKIGPRWTTGVGGTFNERNYRGSFTSVVEPKARISDNIYRGYARLTYSPRELYSADLEVAHERRDSVPNDYSTAGTTVQLSLRVKLGRG